jgi:hypothetical protein
MTGKDDFVPVVNKPVETTKALFLKPRAYQPAGGKQNRDPQKQLLLCSDGHSQDQSV